MTVIHETLNSIQPGDVAILVYRSHPDVARRDRSGPSTVSIDPIQEQRLDPSASVWLREMLDLDRF